MKCRLACLQIDEYRATGNLRRPGHEGLRNPRVPGVRTKLITACRSRQDAVDSYEGERAGLRPLIRADNCHLHETGVRVDLVRGMLTGLKVGSGTAESE